MGKLQRTIASGKKAHAIPDARFHAALAHHVHLAAEKFLQFQPERGMVQQAAVRLPFDKEIQVAGVRSLSPGH